MSESAARGARSPMHRRKGRVAPTPVANEILMPTAVFRCQVTVAQEVL